ncbi:MAG TPA: DNA polymerase III subunit epsilon [Rhodocyclaceae bacterium]
MKQIVLDTETTGLDPKLGHRLIEVAGLVVANRRVTPTHFHRYLNPEREVDAGALAVHGLSDEFLADKPKFADVAADFLEFVRDAELIIHNAAFDVGFLNHELAMLNLPPVEKVCAQVTDTLKMARERHPGKRNNLDALCERYQVSNAHRKLHGALLDAELLAEVYLAMTRGQDSLIDDYDDPEHAGVSSRSGGAPRKPLIVLAASEAELQAHAQVLANIDRESKGNCLWLNDRDPVQSS